MARIFTCIGFAAALGLAGQAFAEGSVQDNARALGKVRDIYVRLAHYVFLERSSGILPRGVPLEFWIDLQLDEDAAPGRKFALALLGDVRDVELGDLVEVDLADLDLRAAPRMRRGMSPLARQERVIAIAAKHYTPLAQQFGQPRSTTVRPPFARTSRSRSL